MGRKLGSKNKVDQTEQVETVVTFEQTEPVKEKGCRDFHCDHPKSLHYGPKTDWCNFTGCKCHTFVA